MGNDDFSKNSQLETLKPSLNPSTFTFPPPRRRPLKSETYHTFLCVLSLSRDLSLSSPIQDEINSAKVGEVQGSSSKEPDSALVDKESVDKGISTGTLVDIDVSDYTNDTREGHENSGQEDVNVDTTMAENVGSGSVVETFNETCVMEFCDGEGFSPVRELTKDEEPSVPEVYDAIETGKDEEPSVREVCDAIETFLHMDTVDGLTGQGEDGEKKEAAEEGNVSKEMEQELQRRGLELEKLIYTSGVMESSRGLGADEETEEGEISGDDGVYDGSVDSLFEDDMPPEKVEEVDISKEPFDKEAFTKNVGQSEIEKTPPSSSFSQNTTNRGNNMMEVERNASREDQNKNSDVFSENEKEGSHGSVLPEVREIMMHAGRVDKPDHATSTVKHPAPSDNISPQSVAKNKSCAVAEEDASSSKNKRKRGPATKERKAKKKRKERIKRAENNRKLGVKRLKLQPVVKPKAISYCRHYLMGKCQEGEKCKFSHDTIPLTKSKPCCHFARHSCMKGDDCPYDHQLSKYPCNNYVSKGFCNRGSDCLFSHEIKCKDGASVTPNVSDSGLKASSIQSNSDPKNQQYILASHKVDAGSCSIGVPVEKQIPEKIYNAPAPKGVNFLFHGNLSAGGTSKQKQVVQPSKTDIDGIKLGHESIRSGDSSQMVNEVTGRAVSRTPKGINFLSFGKCQLNDSSGKAVSSLFSGCDSSTVKSMLGNLSRGTQIEIASKRDDSVNFKNLDGEIASTPVVPRGINFLSFGKASTDYSSAVQQSSFHRLHVESTSTTSQQGKAAPDQLRGLPDKSAIGSDANIASSSKTPFLSHTPTSEHKALRSTLAFAAKFESGIRLDPSVRSPSFVVNSDKKTEGAQSPMKGSSVLDFLYGDGFKTKE